MNQPLENEQQQATEAKLAEYLDGWKRAQADYQNLLKQLSKEREEAQKAAVWGVVELFLQPLDHLDAAMQHPPTPENIKAWSDGVGYVRKQFADRLAELGVSIINPLGTLFNPAEQEAVGEVESAEAPGTVVQVQMVGYKMGEKVLRPARVITAKH